jgi:hypothetical protein
MLTNPFRHARVQDLERQPRSCRPFDGPTVALRPIHAELLEHLVAATRDILEATAPGT